MTLATGMKFKFSDLYFVGEVNEHFAKQFDLNALTVYTIYEVKKLPGFDDGEGNEVGATYGVTKLLVGEGDDLAILDIQSDNTGVWCFIISDSPGEFILEGVENDPEDSSKA